MASQPAICITSFTSSFSRHGGKSASAKAAAPAALTCAGTLASLESFFFSSLVRGEATLFDCGFPAFSSVSGDTTCFGSRLSPASNLGATGDGDAPGCLLSALGTAGGAASGGVPDCLLSALGTAGGTTAGGAGAGAAEEAAITVFNGKNNERTKSKLKETANARLINISIRSFAIIKFVTYTTILSLQTICLLTNCKVWYK